MNREARRHGQHPALPVLQTSKTRILDEKSPNSLVKTKKHNKVSKQKRS